MHISVLLKEAIEGLDLDSNKILLDGTLGAGGHSQEALRRFPGIRVIGLDQDPEALERVAKLGIETRLSNFRNLDQALKELRVEKVDAILLDIGFSSDQLEHSGRGFSFMKDEPLDMRMSGKGISAADILNSWDESAIELILRGFGEEKFSRRIAGEIVRRREMKPFETTRELTEAIENVVPAFYKRGKQINPSTRTFQALRITVNEELEALEEGIAKGFEALNSGGRLAIISFHSLEDRIVKNAFRNLAQEERAEIITKKPIVASEEEIRENPRSRSAKLRIIKKI